MFKTENQLRFLSLDEIGLTRFSVSDRVWSFYFMGHWQ